MIEVIRQGSQICIVDRGRYGYRRYGIPLSGAMDLHSAARANSLLGNLLNAAVLELFMPGHEFLFHESVSIALSGAEADIQLNDIRIYGDQRLEVRKGSIISIGTMTKGCRNYLAVKGGFQSAEILGSKSPIPGYLRRNLTKGDRILHSDIPGSFRVTSSVTPLTIHRQSKISCQVGPEWHLLKKSVQRQLLETEYVIDHKSDRMGYRLKGLPITNHKIQIYSSPVMPGTVQLPADGLPIILMRDCQTTGGYPRILQVSEEDINQLAQRRPGSIIQFEINNDF